MLTKDQGWFYQVDPLRVLGLETLRIGVNSVTTQNFDIHWYQRVYLR